MKYMLLIYTAESAWTPEEYKQCLADSVALCNALEQRGRFISASPLNSVEMATSLRIRNDKSLVTDGPFAETHEQLGGYFLIDVNNLDEAISIAKQIPGAKKGTVEIRPLMKLDTLDSIK